MCILVQIVHSFSVMSAQLPNTLIIAWLEQREHQFDWKIFKLNEFHWIRESTDTVDTLWETVPSCPRC